MSREEVFEIVKEAIVEIMGDLDEEINIKCALKDYGANSIDRADISMLAMENMGCNIPLIEFGKVENIEGLVNVLYEKQDVK